MCAIWFLNGKKDEQILETKISDEFSSSGQLTLRSMLGRQMRKLKKAQSGQIIYEIESDLLWKNNFSKFISNCYEIGIQKVGWKCTNRVQTNYDAIEYLIKLLIL